MKHSLPLYLIFILTISLEVNAQWVQTNGPYGGVSCMVSSPDGILYAGTYGAGIFMSNNDGDAWTPMNNGLTNLNVNDLAIDSTGNLYASVVRKGVFKFSKATNSWSQIVIGIGNWSVSSIHVSSKGYIFAGTILSTGDDNDDQGGGGEVYRSTDGGMTWEFQTGIGGNIIEGVMISSNSIGEVFVASSGGLIKSSDDGETWTSLHGASLHVLYIDNDDRIFIGYSAVSEGGLYRSEDDGITWTQELDEVILSIDGNDNNELYAGTSNNGVLLSSDNGDTWVPIHNNQISLKVIELLIHDDRFLFTSNYNGLYRTSDNGLNWEEKNTGIVSSRINRLDVTEAGHIFAVSTDYSSLDDNIFRSTDQGLSWEKISNTLPNMWVQSMTLGNNGLVMITGHDYNSGKLFRSLDNGETWSELLNGFTVFHTVGVVQNSSGDLFVATDGDGVLKSSDNGETWSNVSFGLNCTDLSSIIIDLEGNLLVGTSCYESGIYKSSDDGATWTPSGSPFNEASIRLLKINSEGVLFAVNNSIHRSVNNGLSWENISEYSSYGTVFEIETGLNGNVLISTFEGVFQSNDNGDTWSEINDGLLSNDSRSVAVAPDGTIYTSIWGNGVWKNNTIITSIPDLANLKGFSVYPNPAKSEITISYPTLGKTTANVYTVNGTLVKSVLLNNSQTRVSLDNLSKGMYIITLTGHDKAQKLLIQ